MPTAAERAHHILKKLERANAHANALRDAVLEFRNTDPFKVGITRDPVSRRPVYLITAAHAVPDSLALIAGDAIQNLATALDHLAYQLVSKDTSDPPPKASKIYFPIGDDQVDYEAKKGRQLPGLSARALTLIDAIRPYRGGNDTLWRLGRLNNIEKHRLLFTVGGQSDGVNLGQIMAKLWPQATPPEVVAETANMGILLKPADKGFPLKPGFELYKGRVDEEFDTELSFQFAVVLNEPNIVEGLPIVETIFEMGMAVDTVIAALLPLLE